MNILKRQSRIYLHLIVNFIVNSLLQVWLLIAANNDFLNLDVWSGVMYTLLRLFLECLTIGYETFWAEADYVEAEGDVIEMVRNSLITQAYTKNWHQVETIFAETQARYLIYELGWRCSAFLRQILASMTALMSIIGNMVWIAWQMPWILVIYFLTLAVVYKYCRPSQPDYEPINRLYRLQNLYTDMHHEAEMHHHSQKNLQQILLHSRQICAAESATQHEDTKLTAKLTIIAHLVTGMNLLLLLSNEVEALKIMIFVAAASNLGHFVAICCQLHQTFQIIHNRWSQFQSIIEPYKSREVTAQVTDLQTLKIYNLGFQMGTFCLRNLDVLVLNRGEIVFIGGGSGQGKSTLMQILAGEHCYSTYQAKISIDDIVYPEAFHAITQLRYYHRQSRPALETSLDICRVVTLQELKYLPAAHLPLLQQALKMACCRDFVDNAKCHMQKFSALSGGQRARVQIASSIYQILTHDYRIVILDEIDRQIEANLMTCIMQNIFNWCRHHQIACLVSAHTTEVANLAYDQRWHITQGMIKKIEN